MGETSIGAKISLIRAANRLGRTFINPAQALHYENVQPPRYTSLPSSVPARPPEWKSVFARLAAEGGIEPDLTRAFQLLSEFWNSLALVSRAPDTPSHRSCPHNPGSACQPSAAFDQCALFVQSVARAAMDSRVDPRCQRSQHL